MKPSLISASLVVASLLLCLPAHARWFKGNTHCHTSLSSDSDTDPAALFSWYKNNGYDFVVPTDHNTYSTREELASLRGFNEDAGSVTPIVDDTFLLIPGEELTTPQHHINGLDLPARLSPANSIEASFELIWANGALPQLNHPEYNYIQGREIVEELAELHGPMFLEIYNSHPAVIRRSGPSSEDIWDAVLTAGRPMWGVAVDDAHTLAGGHTPPGGGFVYVNADELTPDAIMLAMQEGQFYASTGATLESFSWTGAYYEVDAPGATEITFLGERGTILARSSDDYATYTFQGDERYIRARVRSPEGIAWTQPVFLNDLPDNAPPTASFTASLSQGTAPLRTSFDGSQSTDPDGDIVTWRWNFGDGTRGRGEVISHTFENPGTYHVELSVFDAQGALDRSTLTVLVSPTAPEDPHTPEDPETPDMGSPEEDLNHDEIDMETDTSREDIPPTRPSPQNNAQRSQTREGCAQTPGTPAPWPLLLLLLGGFLWRSPRARR